MPSPTAASIGVSDCERWIDCTMLENARPDRCTSAIAESVALARRHHLRAILIDLSRVKREDSQAEQYREIQQLHHTGLDKTYRVAVLAAAGTTDHDFIVMTAQAAGYNMQQFVGRSNAEAWLVGR